eukprot:765506-Hanusia_phi.AAC.10
MADVQPSHGVFPVHGQEEGVELVQAQLQLVLVTVGDQVHGSDVRDLVELDVDPDLTHVWAVQGDAASLACDELHADVGVVPVAVAVVDPVRVLEQGQRGVQCHVVQVAGVAAALLDRDRAVGGDGVLPTALAAAEDLDLADDELPVPQGGIDEDILSSDMAVGLLEGDDHPGSAGKSPCDIGRVANADLDPRRLRRVDRQVGDILWPAQVDPEPGALFQGGAGTDEEPLRRTLRSAPVDGKEGRGDQRRDPGLAAPCDVDARVATRVVLERRPGTDLAGPEAGFHRDVVVAQPALAFIDRGARRRAHAVGRAGATDLPVPVRVDGTGLTLAIEAAIDHPTDQGIAGLADALVNGYLADAGLRLEEAGIAVALCHVECADARVLVVGADGALFRGCLRLVLAHIARGAGGSGGGCRVAGLADALGQQIGARGRCGVFGAVEAELAVVLGVLPGLACHAAVVVVDVEPSPAEADRPTQLARRPVRAVDAVHVAREVLELAREAEGAVVLVVERVVRIGEASVALALGIGGAGFR